MAQTRNRARALLDERIETGTHLVKTRQRMADLREQLIEAESQDKCAWLRATRDAWSPDELRHRYTRGIEGHERPGAEGHDLP